MKTIAAFFGGAIVAAALLYMQTGGLETCAKNEAIKEDRPQIMFWCSVKPIPQDTDR